MIRLSFFALALLFALSYGENNSTKNETALAVQKPRVVVTFLTNTRIFNQSNQTEAPSPFQRIIQFFLSNVMRDLAQQSQDAFDQNEKCSHDEFGFCPACVTRRAQNATEKALLPVTSPNATNASNEVDAQKQKKRHYFLFISGGTENRTTANPLKSAWFDPWIKLVRRRRADDTTEEIAEDTTDNVDDEDNDDDDDELTELPSLKNMMKPKYYASVNSSTYFLTVTIPTVAAFGFVIIGICIVFRASGLCCRIFMGEAKDERATTA